MSQENPNRRRRVRQIIDGTQTQEPMQVAPDAPQQDGAQRAAASQRRTVKTPPEGTMPPRMVVIEDEDDQPDWMVSAEQVSGAASRRTGHTAAEKAEPVRKARSAAQDAGVPAALRDGENAPRAQERKPAARKKPAAPQKAARPQAKAAVKAPKKKLSKKARARRAKKIRSLIVLVLALCALCALLAAGVIGGTRLLDIKQTLDRGDGVFYPNIWVNGIPLEGKTLDEAAAIVTQQVSSLVSNFKITLRTQDGTGRTWDITGEDLKMKYDVADQLDQLWAIGHTGASSTRYEQVKALEEEPIHRYTTLTYDMSAINQILTQIKHEVDRAPVSAQKIHDENKWPPYSYTDDVAGQELNISGMNEKIMAMVDTLTPGVVDLTPTPVEAPITRAYLESQIVKLATYETTVSKAGDYAEARRENIRIGTEKFNHLTIKSGEQVSFNKVTGLRTEKNGFVVALELAYGKYVEGVGGGICQVSSTLYNAVVNAGLEIKSRTQHSLPSSYVDMGLDATVQDNRIDFVFKNNTSANIYIEAECTPDKRGYYHCRFTIWGRPDPNGYSYQLVPEVVDNIEIPEMTYEVDKEAKYVVYDDETHLYSEGQEGYIVDVYRATLDKNGNEVSREKMYTDTYKAVAPITYVGAQPRPTPVPEPTIGSID